MQQVDAVIIGAGPAGSTCARLLVEAGLRVVIIDRARFPRVKLCAGWVSEPIWSILELSPADYPRGLWRWNRCHVRFAEHDYTINASGYFIRRYEFDEFLVRRSGAELIADHAVRSVQRETGPGDAARWLVDGRFRARFVIGAGGTHCPVARALFVERPEPPVGVQERELPVDPAELAGARIGRDGEPELLLHRDLRGYSWNIAKTSWLNIGCGTLRATDVRDAWAAARCHFDQAGHIPAGARSALERVAGYSYYLFHPDNLRAAYRDGAFLVGDALGLAQPFTAEGILPAVLSGRLCAEAIVAGAPHTYPERLRRHSIIRDYALLRWVRDLKGVRRSLPPLPAARFVRPPRLVTAASRRALASGFAWMFSGRALPAGGAIDRVVSLFGGSHAH
jgi:menaquinone-9 beta-reductase